MFRTVLFAALLLSLGLTFAEAAVAPGAFVKACASPTICAGPIGVNVNSLRCFMVVNQGAAGASAQAWVCT